VLVYDKRGTGKSQGEFSSAIYADFVQDAVAAVSYLRSRDDIIPLRIGLFGSSEGGWLTPEVATLAGNIAFIINRCGPPLPWMETVLFEIEKDLEVEGISSDIIQEVLRLRTRVWDFYIAAAADSTKATGKVRELLEADLAAIHNKVENSDLRGTPTTLRDYNAEYYTRYATNISYDPTPFLRELELPMLCVFGENDINVPTAKSVVVLKKLKTELNRDITTKVYPGVGHSLMTWKGITRCGYVAGYLEHIGDWARDHVERTETNKASPTTK
jgi:pimeloyl-ACP methyl ester carboxylesterase